MKYGTSRRDPRTINPVHLFHSRRWLSTRLQTCHPELLGINLVVVNAYSVFGTRPREHANVSPIVSWLVSSATSNNVGS